MKNPEDSRRLSDASQRDPSDSSKLAPQDHARLSEQNTSHTSGINVHDKENVMNLFEDKLEMKVANVGMSLSMSSVTGLADLAEDEIIPKPIPMQVGILAGLRSTSPGYDLPSFDANNPKIYCQYAYVIISDILRKYIITFK